MELANKNGIPWHRAPLPRRWHRCKPHTTGNLDELVERCACGAVRLGGRVWVNKNERRKR